MFRFLTLSLSQFPSPFSMGCNFSKIPPIDGHARSITGICTPLRFAESFCNSIIEDVAECFDPSRVNSKHTRGSHLPRAVHNSTFENFQKMHLTSSRLRGLAGVTLFDFERG